MVALLCKNYFHKEAGIKISAVLGAIKVLLIWKQVENSNIPRKTFRTKTSLSILQSENAPAYSVFQKKVEFHIKIAPEPASSKSQESAICLQ